jgi:hypothetical protein
MITFRQPRDLGLAIRDSNLQAATTLFVNIGLSLSADI